jgi:regulator of sigma E protease
MIEFVGRIIITIICLGLVVVIHEYGHFLVARALGVRVERFTVGFGPEIFGWTSGDTRYALCAVPLGGMVKLAGEFLDERQHKPDEFFSQAWYRRIAIALAGPAMNYLLAFVLFALVAIVWGILQPSSKPVIGDVVPGLPAAQAQLKGGDTIRSINGSAVVGWEEMATMIHASPDKKVVLEVQRPDVAKPLQITVIPQRDPQQGIGLIGIMPQVDRIKPGLAGGVQSAYRDIKLWTLQPLSYLSQKIRTFEGPRELSGPLGIAHMVTKATKEGLSYVIYLVAIISTGLGLFNLFPIPVLDGGHVFLYLIEGIIRRPLSRRVMQFANALGLSIVLTIFLYASYQDVLRWRVGFWK